MSGNDTFSRPFQAQSDVFCDNDAKIRLDPREHIPKFSFFGKNMNTVLRTPDSVTFKFCGLTPALQEFTRPMCAFINLKYIKQYVCM